VDFPLSFDDISLLLAITAMILLITSEVLLPYYRRIKLIINKKRLRNAALTFSTLFLATIVIRIVTFVINS
jgi:hypothetical protein